MSEILLTQTCGFELQFLIKIAKESRRGEVYVCIYICQLLFPKFEDELETVILKLCVRTSIMSAVHSTNTFLINHPRPITYHRHDHVIGIVEYHMKDAMSLTF